MSELRNHHLIRKLLALNLPPDDFVVFGSGPLMAYGLRESRDLDILARGAAWEAAARCGQPMTKPNGTEYVSCGDGEIEVFRNWGPGEWDTDRVIDTADIIGGIRFASLDYTLRWKRTLNRPKDQEDIRLIEAYLSRN